MPGFSKFRLNPMLNLMKVFIYTALFVYFISRLTVIKQSEYYCYGVVLLGIFLSIAVLLGAASKNAKELGVINMIVRIFQTCTPGILICAQLILLIVIYAKNNDIIYGGKELPPMYNIFNNLIFAFLTIQVFLYMKFMNISIKKFEFSPQIINHWTPIFVPLFILAALLTSSCIGELWVIITKFTTDG